MGQKTKVIGFDRSGRCRINVELCDLSLAKLQEMLDSLNRHGKAVGVSQLVREAIIFLNDNGDWTKARARTVNNGWRPAKRAQIQLHQTAGELSDKTQTLSELVGDDPAGNVGTSDMPVLKEGKNP